MKKILFLAIVFFAIQTVRAQDKTNVSDNTIYNTAGIDVKPDFPGGMDEFYRFISKNYNCPKVDKLAGKVYVTFVIEKDGSLTHIKVLRDIGYGTGKEAIRVLELSPKWLPGEQNGQKVRCTFSLPISIMAKL
jgi:protein TonB